MADVKPDSEKTATELLVAVLEEFDEHEGEAILVIWTDRDGGVNVMGNSRRVGALGLLEAGKDLILRARRT